MRFPSLQINLLLPPKLHGVSRLVYLFGEDYDPDLKAFSSLVSPGSRIVDVGANYGTYSLSAAALAGSEGIVWAIEPAPDTSEALRYNVGINPVLNVEVVQVALSDAAGSATLSFSEDPSRRRIVDSGKGVLVEVRTLDSLSLGTVDILKIDVEGSEYEVARGGETLISRDRPIIMLEYSEGATDPRIWGFLAHQLSYDAFRYESGNWRPLATLGLTRSDRHPR